MIGLSLGCVYGGSGEEGTCEEYWSIVKGGVVEAEWKCLDVGQHGQSPESRKIVVVVVVHFHCDNLYFFGHTMKQQTAKVLYLCCYLLAVPVIILQHH